MHLTLLDGLWLRWPHSHVMKSDYPSFHWQWLLEGQHHFPKLFYKVFVDWKESCLDLLNWWLTHMTHYVMTHHESYWDQHEVWYNCRDNDKLRNRYHQHAEIPTRMWLYNAASLKLYFKITSLLLRSRFYVITYRFCFCSNFSYKQYFFHFVSKLDFLELLLSLNIQLVASLFQIENLSFHCSLYWI